MTSVMIKDEYAEVLTTLGDLQSAIDLALQRYTIEQVTTKINELRKKDTTYQKKYSLDYPTFRQRIATDELFIQQIEANISKLWESDLADWEFCYRGMKDWTRKLQTILLT